MFSIIDLLVFLSRCGLNMSVYLLNNDLSSWQRTRYVRRKTAKAALSLFGMCVKNPPCDSFLGVVLDISM